MYDASDYAVGAVLGQRRARAEGSSDMMYDTTSGTSTIYSSNVLTKGLGPYHPQTNGHTKESNREIRQILENVVNPKRKYLSWKLVEALWAYRIAFKTLLGMSPFKLFYGKAYHLSFELEHKAYWTIKKLNKDTQLTGKKRLLELNEMEEFQAKAYENTRFYK
ncbi:uncharacterized protein LOC120176162 [Hibiscus syriacus]|uniref:uncharacterized protein LOC120176162 n=1 Tax=Hibiscus syriacus TaxID=106335 RepID=UPI001924CF37|nr:uncharacterized protein LOC120176162 [Hibiscus syriacus]